MRRGLVVVTFTGLLLAPLGWAVSDRLESRNAFCVSCHLSAGRPLHDAKMKRFEAGPARDLAGAHFASGEAARCIDCHGGASFPNRVRVKVVAARDALRYVIGRFDEPSEMRHPLWDEDCTKCHPRFAPEREDAFHALDVHNVDFEFRCVECHVVHSTAGNPELFFAEPGVMRPVCRSCHEEL